VKDLILSSDALKESTEYILVGFRTVKGCQKAKERARGLAYDVLRNLGIEPRAPRWQRRILPLNQLRFDTDSIDNYNYIDKNFWR
jgi:hypothetical protein